MNVKCNVNDRVLTSTGLEGVFGVYLNRQVEVRWLKSPKKADKQKKSFGK